MGRIDNNFIEVKVNDEPTTFLYPIGRGEEFFEGDDVSIDYFVNEKGQLEVVDIRFLSPTWHKPPDIE